MQYLYSRKSPTWTSLIIGKLSCVVMLIQYPGLVYTSQGVVTYTYVPCRNICNWDQNWVKRSKPFWRANQGIKVTSKLLKSTDQECVAAVWPLTHCEWSDQEPQKGTIKQSSTFLADQNLWSRSRTLQQAACKWLPLARAACLISGPSLHQSSLVPRPRVRCTYL